MHVIGSETCDPEPLMMSPEVREGGKVQLQQAGGGRGRRRGRTQAGAAAETTVETHATRAEIALLPDRSYLLRWQM